jgi:hypothetical protein
MLKDSYCRAVAGTYSWTFDGKALILDLCKKCLHRVTFASRINFQ